jgi:hypothetical protein
MFEVDESLCPLCMEEITPDDDVVYSDGKPLHRKCYDREFERVPPPPEE